VNSKERNPKPAPFDLMAALRVSEVIGEWPDEAREQLAALAQVQRHPRGALLHRRGYPETRFFAIAGGAVECCRVLPDGRYHVLPYLPAGRVFGLAAVLANHPHLFDVRTRTDSTLVCFDGSEMRQFLLARPELLISVAASLSRRFVSLYEQLEDVSNKSLRQRLARVVLQLAHSFGHPCRAGLEVSLRVAQDDLAAMAAASRQRVNVEFGAMVAEGVLSAHYGRITVHDIPRLEEIAGRTMAAPGSKPGETDWPW